MKNTIIKSSLVFLKFTILDEADDYLCHNMPKFNRRTTLDEIDDWICNNEKIFEMID